MHDLQSQQKTELSPLNITILFDISIIKSTDGNVEYYIENSGKVWEVNNGINLVSITI